MVSHTIDRVRVYSIVFDRPLKANTRNERTKEDPMWCDMRDGTLQVTALAMWIDGLLSVVCAVNT